jgi:hypothetical protein
VCQAVRFVPQLRELITGDDAPTTSRTRFSMPAAIGAARNAVSGGSASLTRVSRSTPSTSAAVTRAAAALRMLSSRTSGATVLDVTIGAGELAGYPHAEHAEHADRDEKRCDDDHRHRHGRPNARRRVSGSHSAAAKLFVLCGELLNLAT